MLNSKKVVVVLPAYNAEKTLQYTYSEIPLDIVDEVILVDDASTDETIKIARDLGVNYIVKHEKNTGYGGNQKSCYNKALEIGADIVVMLHPDYQYDPKLLASMVWIIANDVYKVVLGSRILGKGALKGGMPKYKYFANRILTLIENILIGQKLSEYHTGYRAYSREVLESINYNDNSNDFIFDNEFLAQVLLAGYEIAEVTCPTKYFKEASSINFKRSVKYGFGVLSVSLKGFFQRTGLMNFKLYNNNKNNILSSLEVVKGITIELGELSSKIDSALTQFVQVLIKIKRIEKDAIASDLKKTHSEIERKIEIGLANKVSYDYLGINSLKEIENFNSFTDEIQKIGNALENLGIKRINNIAEELTNLKYCLKTNRPIENNGQSNVKNKIFEKKIWKYLIKI